MPQGLRIAALSSLCAAALYCVLAVLGVGLWAWVFALLFVGVGASMNRGLRWAAYLGFVLGLLGLSLAVSAWLNPAMPVWAAIALLVAHIMAIVSLFGHLWKPKPAF